MESEIKTRKSLKQLSRRRFPRHDVRRVNQLGIRLEFKSSIEAVYGLMQLITPISAAINGSIDAIQAREVSKTRSRVAVGWRKQFSCQFCVFT